MPTSVYEYICVYFIVCQMYKEVLKATLHILGIWMTGLDSFPILKYMEILKISLNLPVRSVFRVGLWDVKPCARYILNVE